MPLLPVGRDAEIELQLEVLRLAAAPDDERVALDDRRRRDLADERAVLDAPVGRVAFPSSRASCRRRWVGTRARRRSRLRGDRFASARTAPAVAAAAERVRSRRWLRTPSIAASTGTATATDRLGHRVRRGPRSAPHRSTASCASSSGLGLRVTSSATTGVPVFPHSRRIYVKTDAICSSFSAPPSGGIRPTGPSLPASRIRIAAVESGPIA